PSLRRIRFTRLTSKFACAGASIHWRPNVPTTPGAGLVRIVLPFASCRTWFVNALRNVCDVVTLLPAGSATSFRSGKYVAPFEVYVSFPLLFGNSPRMFGVLGVRVRASVTGTCVQVSSEFDAVMVVGAPELQLKMPPNCHLSTILETKFGAPDRNFFLWANGN